MAFKSGELRMTLLGLALVGLLLLSHNAALVDAENSAGTGKRPNSFSFNSVGKRPNSFSFNSVGKRPNSFSFNSVGKRPNSFSFNSAGGRTLTSFSMNHDAGEGEGHGKAGGGHV